MEDILEGCLGKFRGVTAPFDQQAADRFFEEFKKKSTASESTAGGDLIGYDDSGRGQGEHKENEPEQNALNGQAGMQQMQEQEQPMLSTALNSQAAVLEYASGLAMFGASRQQTRRSQLRRSQVHEGGNNSANAPKTANSTVPASFGPMTRSRSKEIQQQKEQMLATSRARISASGMTRGNGITEGGSRSLITSTPARHNQTAPQQTNQSNGSLTGVNSMFRRMRISGSGSATGSSASVRNPAVVKRPSIDRPSPANGSSNQQQQRNGNDKSTAALDNVDIPTKSQFFRDAHNRDQSLGRKGDHSRERTPAASSAARRAIPPAPSVRAPIQQNRQVPAPTASARTTRLRSSSLPRDNATNVSAATTARPVPPARSIRGIPPARSVNSNQAAPHPSTRAPVRIQAAQSNQAASSTNAEIRPRSNSVTRPAAAATQQHNNRQVNPQRGSLPHSIRRVPTTTRPSQNQPGTPAANKAGNQQNGGQTQGGEGRALQKRENVFERLYKSATPKRTAEERQPRPAVRAPLPLRRPPSLDRLQAHATATDDDLSEPAPIHDIPTATLEPTTN
ncbi:hypothetical protein WR25_24664 [Diploscapter pachys]|uniref:Uncharacterized protein n=1 Tax=Diploscapter pachys TaxID=2018661 RepID=A0A2A2KFB6_9BILA|nr:hypothetical protein WR25_24664 [Diploscapter pachys]